MTKVKTGGKKNKTQSTSCHVAGDCSQSIQQLSLHTRFHKKQIYMYFFRVLKLSPEALVHPPGSLFGAADHGLDVDLEAPVQKLINLPVVIVVISDAGREGTTAS